MYWFTADEHYLHANIIKYCNRPFANVEEMNAEIIKRHNSIVQINDVTIHAGDFCWKKLHAKNFIKQLNGNHIFLRGSHDRWLPNNAKYLWENRIENQFIVVCHYAMRVWPRSHYNSWQLYGHSHGRLNSTGKQWDIGVDNNDFYPLSFEQIKKIMLYRPNNFNFVRK